MLLAAGGAGKSSAEKRQDAKVILIDDNDAVRESTKLLLKSVGVELLAFESPVQYLNELPAANCILLDVRMPDMSGIEVFRRLREANIETPVIFVTGHAHVAMAVAAMRDGAFDFLEKPVEDQKLIDAVFAAIQDDAERRRDAGSRSMVSQKIARLTARERAVAYLIAEGLSSREVAEKLRLSVRTVEGYRSRILAKLEAKSLAQMIRMLHQAQK